MKKWLHNFLVVSYEAVLRILFFLPRYSVFNYIKKAFLQLNGAKIGKRAIFYPGVWIAPGRNLTVGDDVDFALGVIVTTGGGVSIGSRALLGYRCQILSTNHVIPDSMGKIFEAGHNKAPVIIENDVWIGANCIILPGVTVGKGAVVAAGSIVTKDIAAYTIVAGVPARLLRKRD